MKKRLFFALPISESLKAKIAKVINIYDNEVRWIDKDNYHVTLLFLGETPVDQIEIIEMHSLEIASSHTAFTLNSNEISIKGKKDRRMVWVKFEECNAFSELTIRLAGLLNFKTDQKQAPHITLARLKNNREALQALKVPFEEKIEVVQFELWESVAGPNEVKYSCLRTFDLQTGNYSGFHTGLLQN